MHPLVEAQGKALMNDIMSIILINREFDSEHVYNILLKHKVINRRIKKIYCYFNKNEYPLGKIRYRIRINSATKTILQINFYEDEIPQILESIQGE